MTRDFEVGDVVTLNMGGPRMTIEKLSVLTSFTPETRALCKWFESAKLHTEAFPIEALKLADE